MIVATPAELETHVDQSARISATVSRPRSTPLTARALWA